MSSEIEKEEPEYVEDPHICTLPDEIHKAYHKSLTEKSPVYVVAILNPDNKPLIYVEGNKTLDSDGACRLFFREEDADQYMAFLVGADRGGVLSLQKLETTYEQLMQIMITLDRRNKDQGGRGFKIFACTTYKDVVRVVDLFWSGNPNLMV